jgi:hypothetical protein
MIAQWALSIVTDGVPEFETTPWAISFHLAAELMTASMLIIGGIADGHLLLAPGTSRVEKYPFTGRPILISSDNGADIIASLYEL